MITILIIWFILGITASILNAYLDITYDCINLGSILAYFTIIPLGRFLSLLFVLMNDEFNIKIRK